MAASRRSARKLRSETPSGRSRIAPDSPAEKPLSRDRIVTCAVEMLDAHGAHGLTMRRLADRLGSGVMSLYWHVDNKDDVLDLALDAVLDYGQRPQIRDTRDWRSDIIHVIEDWRATMLRHPWSVLLLPRRGLGPNILARLELLSSALSRAGVADANLNAAIWSLWNYVMGAAVTRTSFDLSDDERAAAQQRVAGLDDRYPTIARSRLLLDDDWDGAFRSGLGFLLDGLSPG